MDLVVFGGVVEVKGYFFLVVAGQVVDFGHPLDCRIDGSFGELFATGECIVLYFHAAFAAGVGAGAGDAGGKVTAEPEHVDGATAGFFEDFVGVAGAFASGVFVFFDECTAFDDGYGGVAEATQGRFHFGFVGVVASGWDFSYPVVTAIIFQEREVIFEICSEAFAVPVCFVEEAVAVGVFVAGFVLDENKFAGPVFFHLDTVGIVTGEKKELVCLVESEPFSRFFFQIGDNAIAADFLPGCFQDRIAEVAGTDGCGDDVGQGEVSADAPDRVGTLSTLGDAGDVPVEFFDSVTEAAGYGGYVGLFEGGFVDFDLFDDALQHFAGMREQPGHIDEAFGVGANGDFVGDDFRCGDFFSFHVSWCLRGSCRCILREVCRVARCARWEYRLW